jgi:hypothetical protein
MEPKAIVRKVGGEGSLPPLEQTRSALSIGLERMASKQQAAFNDLSPEGSKLFGAITAMTRYNALVGPCGLIADTHGRILVVQAKVEAAHNDFLCCLEEASSVIVEVFDGPPSNDVAMAYMSKLRAADAVTIRSARALAAVSVELSTLIRKLREFEDEVIRLEPVVVGDDVIPDFKALREAPQEKALAANQGNEAKVLLGEPVDVLSEEAAERQAKLYSDLADSCKPIRWEYRLEKAGTVIAPSEESARGVLAMRLKHQIKPEDFDIYMREA